MPFSQRTRYLAVSLVMLLAGLIAWRIGYPLLIVCIGVSGFLIAGNLWVYSLDHKQRDVRRRKKMEYWTS